MLFRSVLAPRKASFSLLLCLACGAAMPPAQAQYQGGGAQLEGMLDAVENSANWSTAGNAQLSGGQFQQRPVYQKPFLNQGVPCHVPVRSVPTLSSGQMLKSLQPQQQNVHFTPGQMTYRLLRAANSMPGGAGAVRGYGGGGMSGGGDAASNFYRAQDQADRAREAYDRSWHGDKYNREQAAEEAQYAARQARREADQAYGKVGRGDPNAQTYAEKALSAAQDAQSYADKAETNAERAEDNSRRGW